MGMFNVFRQQQFFKRPAKGTYQNGRYVTPDPEYFNAFVSLQPDAGLNVDYREEGRRDSGQLKCYTNFDVVTTSRANADILIAFGYEWELSEVSFWRNNLINHNKFKARKIGKAPEFIDDARIIVTGELRITAMDETRIVN